MKNGVKNIQAAAYNGACTVLKLGLYKFSGLTWEAPEKNFPHIESHSCMKIGEMVDSINSREKIGK